MAATTQSTTYAAMVAANTNFASRTLSKIDIEGPPQYARIVVDLTAEDVATTTVLTLFKLPSGARVIPGLSFITTTDAPAASAFTVDIGDIVDPNRYADGTDATALGTRGFIDSTTVPAGETTALEVEDTGDSTTDTSTLLLTVATSTTPEVGQLIVHLAYKCL